MATITTAVDGALAALHAGRLAAFPTETVYGLGARAADEAAVRAVFALKGRPADHPLIIHLPDADALGDWAAAVPAVAQELARRHLPGPLTLVLPRRPGHATVAAGGHDTVALRVPAHPLAQALVRQAGPLVAPSANRFGRPSPTTAAHVAADFPDADLIVLDGGATEHGLESTVVDLCDPARPLLLRPGILDPAAVAAVTGPLHAPTTHGGAPGTLPAHYAPRQPVRLLDDRAFATAVADHPAATVGAMGFDCPAGMDPALWHALPRDPAAAGRQLFAALRRLEATAATLIVVQSPPATPAWLAVTDRLERAARASA